MKKNILKMIIAIGAISLVTGCGKNTEEVAEVSLLSLDINPSIELCINPDKTVDSVTPINDDAKALLEPLNLEKDSLDNVVSEIMVASIEKGYLKSADENDILVSIDGTTTEETLKIKDITTNAIDKVLQENSLQAVVATQEIDITDDIRNKSTDEQVSFGKAYAVEEINKKLDTKIEDVKDTSIKDIVDMGKQAKIFDEDLEDLYDNAKEDIKEGVDDAKDAVEDVADDVKNDLDDAKDVVEKGADDVKDAVEKDVDDAKQEVKKATDDVKDAVEKDVDTDNDSDSDSGSDND